RRDVADENHTSTLTDAVDGCTDRFCFADSFTDKVYSGSIRELNDPFKRTVRNCLCGAQFLTQGKPSAIRIRHTNARTAGHAQSLLQQESDGASPHDQSCAATCDGDERNCMQGDGNRFEQGSFVEDQVIWKAMYDARRDRYKLGESAGPAVVSAGDSEN